MILRSHPQELRDTKQVDSHSQTGVISDADGYAWIGDTAVFRGHFEQIHIDAARFSTDDFNPFHDPIKWRQIAGNPFNGPLVLGFQYEALIESLILHLPNRIADEAFATEQALTWTHYEFTFASPLTPGEHFEASVRAGRYKQAPAPAIAHRVLIQATRHPVLLGFVRRTSESPGLPVPDHVPFTHPLRQAPDRLTRSEWFLKRKFASTGHAKNFLAGSRANPADWFDELEGRVNFPDLFAPALLSCALLEQAHASGHDFFNAPLVYAAHRISVHGPTARALRSNEPIHLLVRAPKPMLGKAGLSGHEARLSSLGLIYSGQEDRLLAQAEVQLAPLAVLLRDS
ncbi:MAG TPA: hypothetical protein PK820_08415 [Candidatus Competibacteraceae bacterium]|nr:hypothetical protein [Candidatus Competibacteraceae bacterium]MCP5133860.1 hypothetical protein [Gammaproteobacteria bacterium]HPF58801.1 hypothetical protein [Candidatus Competibacteraceae bacterium]